MAYKTIPKIDERVYEDIIEEIARLAGEYAPEWKFSPDDPDAGTALACVFAHRTAETVERLNRTPLNHRREFYNMLGASPLPAIPASGYVRFKPSGINGGGTFIKEGFGLFSPIVDERGTRLAFETTQSAWVVPVNVKEVVYADRGRDMICFREEGEKIFEPTPQANSNKRYLCFGHELLGSITENCRLYMTVSGADGKRWSEKLSDPTLARFAAISDNGETEAECFDEDGRLRIAAPRCGEIKAEIKDIREFENLSFGGISISFEGRGIKPDSVFSNGELETDSAFYAFGEAPAVYDSVYIESAAAFSKPGAGVTLAFDMDFAAVVSGELPKPVIPDKLFVKKSDVRAPEPVKSCVGETVWEYWNGTGFAAIRELEGCKNIFSGIGEDGSPVRRSRYELKFTCPSDISPVLVGAAQRLCVRARIKRMKNAYAFPSEKYLPRLENIRVSYKYDRPVPVSDVVITNNCEKGPPRRVRPFSRLSESALYIGLDAPARNFTLLVCRGGASDQFGGTEWSVLTDDGWESVKPRTNAALAGFFIFEARRAPGRGTLFGRTAYWLKAELDGSEDISFDDLLLNCVPVTQTEEMESFCSDNDVERIDLGRKNILELQVYINTAEKNRDEKWERLSDGWTLDGTAGIVGFFPPLSLPPNSRTVRLKYRCGGGAAGNLPANCEFVPSLTDGAVCGASNPFPLSGGRDGEDASRTEARLAGELRHRNRPITKRDIEDLLIGEEILSARVSADCGGGLNIDIVSSRGISAEDVRRKALSALSGVLPLGAGGARVSVVYENG